MLNFSELMYGDEEMLREIHKIASKHVKNIELVDKIREEEKLLGVPLMERRLMKLRVAQTGPRSPKKDGQNKVVKVARRSGNRSQMTDGGRGEKAGRANDKERRSSMRSSSDDGHVADLSPKQQKQK